MFWGNKKIQDGWNQDGRHFQIVKNNANCFIVFSPFLAVFVSSSRVHLTGQAMERAVL